MKKILFFSVIAFLGSCIIDYYNHKLSIVNKSGKEISVLESNDIEAPNDNYVAYYMADWVVIKPDSSRTLVMPGNEDAWHDYIQEGHDKKLYLYIFETNTLKEYKNNSIQELVRIKKYFKSYTYSESDLDKINWTVIVDK